MKKECVKEVQGLVIPSEVIQQVGLGNCITVEASEGVIIAKKTKMTTLEVLTTIEQLESVVENLFEGLIDVFQSGNECSECACCDNIVEDNVEVPSWAKRVAGIAEDARFCMVIPEDEERIILEPVEYRHNISDVKEEMRERLRDLGICLEDVNESIMQEEIVYDK